MPSAEVLEALEDLHQQIDRMQPAIRQVEIAEELITEVKKLPEEHVKLIGKIKEQELRFKDKISNELKGYAQELNQQVGTVVQSANGTMSNLAQELGQQVDAVVQSANGTMTSLATHDEKLQELRENIKVYYNKISGMQLDMRIDAMHRTCETRFEKLEVNSSAIQLGIQTVQSRFDLIETNIGNRLREEADKQRVLILQTQAQLKQQKAFTIITWVLIVLATALIFILKK